MQNIKLLLNENKLKATPQRLMLLKVIQDFGHIDIDSLYSKIHTTFPSISLATLYKNVNDMISSNILKELKIEGSKTKYELAKESHIHTICNNCGKVEDLFVDNSNINKLANNTTFSVDSFSVNLFGHCGNCK